MTEYNIQARFVYCPLCQLQCFTAERAPKCSNCGGNMITQLKSLMEDTKSADDLAK